MPLDDLDTLFHVDTKMEIVEALRDIMRESSFEKSTVVDICERANVSRATFYRLFDDKYSIVQWFIRYAHSSGAAQIGRTLSWYEGYYITESFVMRNREFFDKAAESFDYNSLDNYAPRYRTEILKDTLVNYYNMTLTPHLLFDIAAAVTLECELFPRWHRGYIDADLETVCRWMSQNVPTQLFSILNQPKRAKL